MNKFVCTPNERKHEVAALLIELNLQFEFTENNKFKVSGKRIIYGEFLSSGHVHLEKESKQLRRVHMWTCEGMKAITSYIKQHAL